MLISDKVREYVLENFLFTDDQTVLSNDDSFLAKGIIDSTGVLEVVLFLEEDFGIKVDDEDMIMDNLDSVEKISAFVSGKISATSTVN